MPQKQSIQGIEMLQTPNCSFFGCKQNPNLQLLRSDSAMIDTGWSPNFGQYFGKNKGVGRGVSGKNSKNVQRTKNFFAEK